MLPLQTDTCYCTRSHKKVRKLLITLRTQDPQMPFSRGSGPPLIRINSAVKSGVSRCTIKARLESAIEYSLKEFRSYKIFWHNIRHWLKSMSTPYLFSAVTPYLDWNIQEMKSVCQNQCHFCTYNFLSYALLSQEIEITLASLPQSLIVIQQLLNLSQDGFLLQRCSVTVARFDTIMKTFPALLA